MPRTSLDQLKRRQSTAHAMPRSKVDVIPGRRPRMLSVVSAAQQEILLQQGISIQDTCAVAPSSPPPPKHTHTLSMFAPVWCRSGQQIPQQRHQLLWCGVKERSILPGAHCEGRHQDRGQCIRARAVHPRYALQCKSCSLHPEAILACPAELCIPVAVATAICAPTAMQLPACRGELSCACC